MARGLYILWPLDFYMNFNVYGEVCPKCAHTDPDPAGLTRALDYIAQSEITDYPSDINMCA